MRGWFHGTSFFGSITGAIAFCTRMIQLSQIYTARKLEQNPALTPSERQTMFGLRLDIFRTAAALSVVLPLELAFVIIAKLLVLHRLQRFAVSRSPRLRTWDLVGRAFLAVVVAVNAVGFCSNIVAAVHYNQAAFSNGAAGTAWGFNNSVLGVKYEIQAYQSFQTAGQTGSIQRFCEVAVLLLIIAVFLVVGVNSAAVIASAMRIMFAAKEKLTHSADATELSAVHKQNASVQGLVAAATEQGKQLQRQVVCTVLFVFLAVLVRSVFSVMYALAQALQDNANPCNRSPCNPCHNVYSNIHYWILYSPVFQPLVMAIASPLALLVALWGMSDARVLEQMTTAKARLKLQWRSWRQQRR